MPIHTNTLCIFPLQSLYVRSTFRYLICANLYHMAHCQINMWWCQSKPSIHANLYQSRLLSKVSLCLFLSVRGCLTSLCVVLVKSTVNLISLLIYLIFESFFKYISDGKIGVVLKRTESLVWCCGTTATHWVTCHCWLPFLVLWSGTFLLL